MHGSSNTNSSNAELNPICHLLALVGAHHILHVSRIRVKRVALQHAVLSQKLTLFLLK
jgi:hypothetical protein